MEYPLWAAKGTTQKAKEQQKQTAEERQEEEVVSRTWSGWIFQLNHFPDGPNRGGCVWARWNVYVGQPAVFLIAVCPQKATTTHDSTPVQILLQF